MILRLKAIPALTVFATALSCGSVDSATTKSSTSAFSGAESGQSAGIGGHSCEEQASWGKCSEPWMHPVCSYACSGSTDQPNNTSPDAPSSQGAWVGGHSCEEQASWGKCSESWMHPVCSYACSGSGLGSGLVYYWIPNAPQPEQPQAAQPQEPQYAGLPQPPRYGTSTLPYPYNNNGLMIPNLNPYERWSNNTGLLYPNVGSGNSFPYSNSTSDGVMGTGTGLVTTNWSGGYSNSPYWNGQRTPWK